MPLLPRHPEAGGLPGDRLSLGWRLRHILEQMRLCLAKKDFIRTAIISKKINPDVFKDETLQDLKVKYYELMIQKHAIDKSYLESAKAFYAIFDTPSVQVRRQGRRQDDQPLPSASCYSSSC